MPSAARGGLWAPAAAISLAGFLFSFVATFPGLMTWDSFVLWHMGVEWQFRDWHHPLIAVLMGLGRFLRDDPSPYLFFQLALVWGGIYFYTLALREQVGKSALAVALIGFLPFNLGLFGYLHKTPLLTACFLFSCSWLALSYTRGRALTVAQLVVLPPILFLGSVVREYSYVSALPILWFMIWMLLRTTPLRPACGWAAAFAVVVALVFFGANQILLYSVLDTQRQYKSTVLYRFDLAAMHALTDDVYGEEFLKDSFRSKQAARRQYEKDMNRSVYQIIRMYRSVDTLEDARRMRAEWWRAVLEHPGVYLRHRLNAALRSLGASSNSVSASPWFRTKSRQNIHGLKKWNNALSRWLREYVGGVERAFFMMPWFWGLWNVVLSASGAALVLDSRRRALLLPHCVMLWSGLLLLAPYLLVCFSPETRFTHWVAVSTSFGGTGLAWALYEGVRKERRHARPAKDGAVGA